MSKSRNNPLTAGLSGKLGNILVFRCVKGETVLATAPGPRKSRGTEQQQAHRNRFRIASAYASGQLSDPEARALYQEVAKRKNYKSARTLALADYFNAPSITLVDVSAYAGKAGEKIVIIAEDELEVKTISVDLVNGTGVSIENGLAIRRMSSSVWEYIATTENTVISGTKVTVKATDRPGNRAMKEVVLP